MSKCLVLFAALVPLLANAQEVLIEKLDLNKFIENGLEINKFNFTSDGKTGFFTATRDWEHQIPFLVTFGEDTVVQQISELGMIYNGAISPSGNRIIYAVRNADYTTLLMTKKTSNGWSKPIDLSEKSKIMGGYFQWFAEDELYFYVPDNAGDLVKGRLVNSVLEITDRFRDINTTHTEFSPFVGPDGSYLIFTKYVDGDSSQQGLMISHNQGTKENPEWYSPSKIEGIPYGWGAFVKDDLLYFSDGSSIYFTPITTHLKK